MTDMKKESNQQSEEEGLKLRRKVLELADIENQKIIDIGAGPLSIIAAKDFNCTVTSVDIDREKIEVWREKSENEGVSDRIKFEEEDATGLSYPDDAFDAGICFGALHHIPQEKRDKVISEILRVSRERFILSEFTVEGFLEIHTPDEFEPVDLGHLEKILKQTGDLKVIPLEKMMIYIVEKKKD